MADMTALKKTFFSKYLDRFSQYFVEEHGFDAEEGVVTFMLSYAVVSVVEENTRATGENIHPLRAMPTLRKPRYYIPLEASNKIK